jgi:hypothetical protein
MKHYLRGVKQTVYKQRSVKSAENAQPARVSADFGGGDGENKAYMEG